MSRDISLILGVILALLGAFLVTVSFIPETNSTIWLNETFVVPPINYRYHFNTPPYFPEGTTMHISFNVTDSVSDSVEFIILDNNNFQKMESSQPFNYYVQPSRILISSMDIEWTPPTNQELYFVWINSEGYEEKTVSAFFLIETRTTMLPPAAASFSFIILFSGIAAVGYGKKPLSNSKIATKTKIGYILAVLGGLFGIIIGLYHLDSENQNEKYHGKVIVSVGTISTIVFVLLFLV